MLAVLIIFTSTLLQEAAASIGKASVRKRRETVYSLAFLFALLAAAYEARVIFHPHY